MDNEEKVKDIILSNFEKNRVVSLLLFGSRAFGSNIRDNSDYDFMLVMNKYESKDTAILRKVSAEVSNVSHLIGLNLVYWEDVQKRGKDNFQFRSNNADFYRYLAGVKVVFGRNPFREDPLKISNDKVREYMSFRIQEYNGGCDKLSVKNVPIDEVFVLLKKYTQEMLRFFSILIGLVDIEDISTISYPLLLDLLKSNSRFSQAELEKLNFLFDENSEISVAEMNDIRRVVYNKFLEEYSKS